MPWSNLVRRCDVEMHPGHWRGLQRISRRAVWPRPGPPSSGARLVYCGQEGAYHGVPRKAHHIAAMRVHLHHSEGLRQAPASPSELL